MELHRGGSPNNDMHIYLLVDSRGWPAPLDPEMVSVVIYPHLPAATEVHYYPQALSEQWYQRLPSRDAVLFLFLTGSLSGDWQAVLQQWLGPRHRLYILYNDAASQTDIRQLAKLTVAQPVARAPYRIVQHNATGLDKAGQWMASIVRKLAQEDTPSEVVNTVVPTLRIAPTHWRNMPSNRQDQYAYPDQWATSANGAGRYQLVASSYRGKTHQHAGTFREDAMLVSATPYWNILAVADGAGTATLARVGSNLAVTSAVQAIQNHTTANPPATDELGQALVEGLKAAYQALRSFAMDNRVPLQDLHTTLQLVIHWPQDPGCLIGLVHIGDGLIAAETTDGKYYVLTEPDTDPDDGNRTLFLTTGPLREWLSRARVYQFDEPLDIVALMTDGVSSDLEPYAELLHNNLFEALRQRVLCYPLRQREQALMAFISYERRGSFDDRTIAVLSRE